MKISLSTSTTLYAIIRSWLQQCQLLPFCTFLDNRNIALSIHSMSIKFAWFHRAGEPGEESNAGDYQTPHAKAAACGCPL
jgi:hypothetical protein